MSDVWFTSDTHWNHERCRLQFRPNLESPRFDSLEEMNESMIERWNAVVKPGDRVYHLGDFALKSVDEAAVISNRLKGNIYLIRGNHEKVAEHTKVRGRFVWIKDYFDLKVGTQHIVLMHYAMRTWNKSHHGAWHLYGHSHGSLPELPGSLSFDVGVDSWDFRPVNYDQVASKMATKMFVPVDHHKVVLEEWP